MYHPNVIQKLLLDKRQIGYFDGVYPIEKPEILDKFIAFMDALGIADTKDDGTRMDRDLGIIIFDFERARWYGIIRKQSVWFNVDSLYSGHYKPPYVWTFEHVKEYVEQARYAFIVF